MTEKDTKALTCPFCGAPQRKYVSSDTVQLKCEYCGGILLTPPWMGGETYRCFNHPERLAIGKCNDCWESFCGDCLRIHTLNTESARVTLSLCPNCLKKRYVEKADTAIYLGIILVLLGIFLAPFSLPFSLPFGLLIVLIGAGAIVYGASEKAVTPRELTFGELREEKREAELATVEGMKAEEIYDELLTRYTSRWGARTGIELLENEIKAYVRHGTSFPEAVQKIYQRQEKKPP